MFGLVDSTIVLHRIVTVFLAVRRSHWLPQYHCTIHPGMETMVA